MNSVEDDGLPRIAVRAPVFVLGAIISLGSLSLYALGRGRWTLGECVYFAIISATTVGFGELDSLKDVPGARVVTALVILSSLGVVAYFQSVLTTFLVQDVFGHRLRRRRMQHKIDLMREHVLVAGAGSTGRHVIEELVATSTPFVVVDRSRRVLDELAMEFGEQFCFVVGDATHDAVLSAAGIERAKGIVAALTEDKDNLYVTLSARGLNATARIVAKAVQPEAVRKMVRAGANATVSPHKIGGLRMASEMLRPTAVQFLDRMLQAKGKPLRVEEVTIPTGSWFGNRVLRDLPIRTETGVLVVAIYEGDDFVYNPDPATALHVGMTLVVMGEVAKIERLRALAARKEAP